VGTQKEQLSDTLPSAPDRGSSALRRRMTRRGDDTGRKLISELGTPMGVG
jgi:hypothetical protein